MATAYIYNAFGQYEKDDKGELGITLTYAGVGFWLPFEKVTPIPTYNFRELDHEKSTASLGEMAVAVYSVVRVPGERIVEELTMTQIPFRNADLGIVEVTGKRTGALVQVCDGRDAESGVKTYIEVPAVEATKSEKEAATAAATQFKKAMCQEYLQSKREKMLGGQGRMFPDSRIRAFMEELNIEDIDDISAHSKHGGFNPEMLTMILKAVREDGAIAHAAALADAVENLRRDVRTDKTAALNTRKEKEQVTP